MVELIEKLEKIKKNIRTWGCGTSRFQLWHFKEGHTFLFSTGQIFRQKLLKHIRTTIVLKRFRIVTHCFFVKLLFSTA